MVVVVRIGLAYSIRMLMVVMVMVDGSRLHETMVVVLRGRGQTARRHGRAHVNIVATHLAIAQNGLDAERFGRGRAHICMQPGRPLPLAQVVVDRVGQKLRVAQTRWLARLVHQILVDEIEVEHFGLAVQLEGW